MINLLALAPSKISLEKFSWENKAIRRVAATAEAIQFFADFPFEMRAHAHIRINFGNEVFHIQFHLFHCSIGMRLRIFVSFIGSFVEKKTPKFSLEQSQFSHRNIINKGTSSTHILTQTSKREREKRITFQLSLSTFSTEISNKYITKTKGKKMFLLLLWSYREMKLKLLPLPPPMDQYIDVKLWPKEKWKIEPKPIERHSDKNSLFNGNKNRKEKEKN